MGKEPIKVPLDGHTAKEMEGVVTRSWVSWHKLLPYIKHEIVQKGNEEVVGLEVADDGVTVVIEYKNDKR